MARGRGRAGPAALLLLAALGGCGRRAEPPTGPLADADNMLVPADANAADAAASDGASAGAPR